MMVRRHSIPILMASRLVYSMNWYNLAPAIYQVSSAFNVSVDKAGLVFAFFLLGAGLFQVPAGLIAAKWGSRNNCVLGLGIMSASGFAEVIAGNFDALLFLRFLSGFGAAFFFSSAVSVLNDSNPEKLGQYMGYYNAAFDIGGGIAVFAFTPITSFFGLHFNEELQASITAVTTLIFFLGVNQGTISGNFEKGALRNRIKNPLIWLLAIAFSGFWSTTYVYSEYLKDYATFSGIPLYYAGALGSSVLFFGILGSFFSGRIRKENLIRNAVWMVIALCVSVIWIPFLGVAGMWVSALVVGMFTVSISSLEYSTVVFIEKDRRFVALNSGLFNSIQILLGFTVTVAFTYVLVFGYEIAWIFIGILPAVTLPLVLVYARMAAKMGVLQPDTKKIS